MKLGKGANRPEASPQRTFSNLSRHYLQLFPLAGLTVAALVTARCLVLDQAPGGVETALVPLWSLMRFLSLRLKPKAAARPRMGSGPGTFAGLPLELALTSTEIVSPEPSVQVARVPESGIPNDKSDIPVKVDLLLMAFPEAYVESIASNPQGVPPRHLTSYSKAVIMPLSFDERAVVFTMTGPREGGPTRS